MNVQEKIQAIKNFWKIDARQFSIISQIQEKLFNPMSSGDIYDHLFDVKNFIMLMDGMTNEQIRDFDDERWNLIMLKWESVRKDIDKKVMDERLRVQKEYINIIAHAGNF